MKETIVYLDSSSTIKRYIMEPGSTLVKNVYLKAYSGEVTLAFSTWNIGEILAAFDKAKMQDRLSLQKYMASKKRFLFEARRLVKLGILLLVPVKTGLLSESWKLIEKHHVYQADALQIVSAKAVDASEFLTSDKGLFEIAKKEKLNSTYAA